jgi:hypothetical protein
MTLCIVLSPRSDWCEKFGAVLWWKFPVVELPYLGSPLDEDFPEYVTHWTFILLPDDPSKPAFKDLRCDGCWENSNYPEDQCTMDHDDDCPRSQNYQEPGA